MKLILEYRGRQITTADVAFIKGLIAGQPQSSRRDLSLRLCAAWNWVQANGHPRDMVCRGLLLVLDRAGHITLPAARSVAPAPWRRRQPPRAEIDATPVRGRLGDLGPLEFRQVRRSAEERLFDSLIETHHYLGYTQPVGEHLKFLVYAGTRPLACFAWSSAPRHLGPRDRFLGWSVAARRSNVGLVAYNSRFLILPWVEVPHLASHLLGRMARLLPREWERLYGHPVYFAETFTDPTRFRGTCYRAANWILLGQTTGRGKADLTHRANRPLKDVWGYPLARDFRERLARVS
ncbi:MAG: DUF4338 domain-containing protein [bacterium]